MPFGNEQELAQIRDQCRTLAVANEFAINGHENRISYIVGSGHAYRAAAARGQTDAEPLVREVQLVLDEFIRLNRWHQRQQEIVRRKDRDGECFLRLFTAADGTTRVRFVEPAQVAAPSDRTQDPSASFGVQTDPDDVETVVGYWIDGRLVDAAEIQHRKANVNANVKRGLPLFYPVRKNLRRAEKLLRNMSVVAEIQSAIAVIRKHTAATAAGLGQFVANQADLSVTSAATGRTSHFRRYAPGTILDAVAGTDYEFPAAGIDAARYVTVLQAELRAIASRLVMPEFMLTQRRQQRQLQFDDGGRGSGGQDVRPAPARDAPRQHRAFLAGPISRRGRRPSFVRRPYGGRDSRHSAHAGGPRPSEGRPGRSDFGAQRRDVGADDGHAQRAGSRAGAGVDPRAGEPWLRATPWDVCACAESELP